LNCLDQIIINQRETKFNTFKTNTLKIKQPTGFANKNKHLKNGLNLLVNRFYALRQCIAPNDLNLSLNSNQKNSK
jgi:hypothetical protein